MNKMGNIISGTSSIIVPLISFNCIVDLDFGLFELIRKEYLDKTIFNEDYFLQNPRLIIQDLYLRTEKNPLYLFAKSNIDRNLLDDYYKEFLETKMDKIYEYSITTSVLKLIDIFNESLETKPILLCYNQTELDILNNEESLSNNRKILLSELHNTDIVKQIYVKDIDELKYFKDCMYKYFYISSFRLNMTDSDEDFIDNETLTTLIKKRNNFGIFDIYSAEIIGKRV